MSSFNLPSRGIGGVEFEAALLEIRRQSKLQREQGAMRNLEAMKTKAQERQARLLREAQLAASRSSVWALVVVSVTSVLTISQITLPFIA